MPSEMIQKLERAELEVLFGELVKYSRTRFKVATDTDVRKKWNGLGITMNASRFSRLKPNSKDPISDPNYRKDLIQITEKLQVMVKRLDDGAFNLASKSASDAELQFVYHYVPLKSGDPYKVKKAHLNVDLKTRKTTLTFYKPHTRFSYRGEVIKIQNSEQVCLLFEYRQYPKEEEDRVPSVCYLDCEWQDLFRDAPIIGAYTSIGPNSGTVVLTRTQINDFQTILRKSEVDPIILRLLFGKSFSVGHNGSLLRIQNHELILKQLDQFVGVYMGYCVGFTSYKEAIHELGIEFLPGGRVRLSWKNSGFLEGYVMDYRNYTLSCGFNYKPEKSQFGLQLTLRTKTRSNGIPRKSMIGIFSGIDERNDPMAGRIIFQPVDIPFDRLDPEVYGFMEDERITSLFQEKKYLQAFISGEYDDFIEKRSLFEGSRHFSSRPEDLKMQTVSIQKAAGKYWHIRLSSDRDKIYITTLTIQMDGTVNWLISEGKTANQFLVGRASFLTDHILSVFYTQKVNINNNHINKPEGKNWHQHQLIYLGDRRPEHLQLLEGVSTSFTSDNDLRCSREIYQRVDQFGDGPKERLIKVQDVAHHPELHQIFTFLTAAPENMILSKRRKRLDYQLDQYQYGNTLFGSAVLAAARGKSREMVMALLEFAVEQGFHYDHLVKFQIEKGAFNGLIEWSDWEKVRPV